MSSPQDAQSEVKSSGRRRPTGSSSRKRRPTGPKRDTEEGGEPRERKERPPSVPFPTELIGKKSTGFVSAVVRRGRLKFGFINLGTFEEKPDHETPRIYFTFTGLTDGEAMLRRGYQVEFVAAADEQGRPYANDIKLTEAGKAYAVEREAAIAQKRVERAAEQAANPREPREAREPREKKERAPRERRERKPVEERLISLNVSCEGKSEVKTLEINANQSVGKLKSVACTAFDAPLEYNVFHVSSEAPQGVYLTKSLLVKLNSGDSIRLAAPTEAADVAK